MKNLPEKWHLSIWTLTKWTYEVKQFRNRMMTVSFALSWLLLCCNFWIHFSCHFSVSNSCVYKHFTPKLVLQIFKRFKVLLCFMFGMPFSYTPSYVLSIRGQNLWQRSRETQKTFLYMSFRNHHLCPALLSAYLYVYLYYRHSTILYPAMYDNFRKMDDNNRRKSDTSIVRPKCVNFNELLWSNFYRWVNNFDMILKRNIL